jgi:hypothetical protein
MADFCKPFHRLSFLWKYVFTQLNSHRSTAIIIASRQEDPRKPGFGSFRVYLVIKDWIPSLLLISITFLLFANTNYLILLLLYLFTFSLVFPEFLFVYLRMPNFGVKFLNLAGMPGGSINLHLATTLMAARKIEQQIKLQKSAALQKCHVSWTLGNSGKLAAGKIVCGVFIERRNLLQDCKILLISLISDKHLSCCKVNH